jgi:ribosomal protein L7/L12
MVDDMQFAKVTSRVALLERQVEFLLTQLKMDYRDSTPIEQYPDVAELMRNGRMIEAIKLYRSKTGVGLAEAKDFVESMLL